VQLAEPRLPEALKQLAYDWSATKSECAAELRQAHPRLLLTPALGRRVGATPSAQLGGMSLNLLRAT